MFPRFQLKKKNPVYQESKRTKTVVQLRIRKKRKKKEEETKAKSEQKKKKNRKEGKGKRGKIYNVESQEQAYWPRSSNITDRLHFLI